MLAFGSMVQFDTSRAFMTLRPYQSTLKSDIINAWSTEIKNICAVLPTGGGKTVVMSSLFTLNYPEIAIAHRRELVSQISLALARAGLYHRIIAPPATIRFIVGKHVEKIGKNYYDARSPLAVAAVDTLIRRFDDLTTFLKRVSLWQTDEAHHLQTDNKWGKAVEQMPQARGVGWTATPLRADKRGLRRGDGHSGVFDHMIVGPDMRELIRAGYLADYRIISAPSDIATAGVAISKATGDFNSFELRDAAHRSHITGDIVKHYLKFAAGKRGVTFAVDVELAHEHAEAFRAAGVPAAVLSAKTPDAERFAITDRFERGELLQIVNVDVLGEGYDCPAIEVVSFARPTASYGLFVQQFGRGLRPLAGKSHGVIIDHVGNIFGPRGHGLPDKPRIWSLDGAPRRDALDPDELPLRCCPNPECFRVFEGYDRVCPYCGFRPTVQQRDRPELVDGDLTEIDAAALARLRGEAEAVMSPERPLPVHAGRPAVIATQRRHVEQQTAQAALRDTIAWWAGYARDGLRLPDGAAYQRFFRTFGLDVLTAQTLNAADAAKLTARINDDIERLRQSIQAAS